MVLKQNYMNATNAVTAANAKVKNQVQNLAKNQKNLAGKYKIFFEQIDGNSFNFLAVIFSF